jgi:hypothetical protein
MIELIASWTYRNRVSVIAVAVFAVCALLAYHIHTSADNFARAYRDYAVLANTSDLGAIVPGAANNPVRVQINDVLTQVLANKMTDRERLALSEEGVNLLTYSENQIDAISPKLDATDASAKNMAASTDFITSVFAKGLPEKIIALTKARSGAISDIRAYSYRADFDTKKIFEHIVSEKGALPYSYVQELNSDIPAEEEQFNSRQNRYNDLQNTVSEIKDDFSEFASRFSIKNAGE